MNLDDNEDPERPAHTLLLKAGILVCEHMANLEKLVGKEFRFFAAPPAWQAPQPQLADKRLLVIEDNATNRRIITQRGQQWGMTVETAANSRDALARLAEGDLFDAVTEPLQGA